MMQIHIDNTNAEILLRLISGQPINSQEYRNIIEIEEELREMLSIKRFDPVGWHLYSCRYHGVVPASMCPCDCHQELTISKNVENIKRRSQ